MYQGSGKSSLVNEVLYKSLAQKINKSKVKPGLYDKIEGIDQLDKIINLSPLIGRTPRLIQQHILVCLMIYVMCLRKQMKLKF